MIKFTSPKSKIFSFKSIILGHQKYFTVYSNQHQRPFEFIDGKKVIYDDNLNEYENTIQAFLDKRWTTKEELRKYYKY